MRKRNNNRKTLTKHITHHSKIEDTKRFKRRAKFMNYLPSVNLSLRCWFSQQQVLFWIWYLSLTVASIFVRDFFENTSYNSKAATGDVLEKNCSKKCYKFHRKTPALKSLFNRVAGLQAFNFIKKILQLRCFPVTFVKVLRTLFWRTTANDYFWNVCFFTWTDRPFWKYKLLAQVGPYVSAFVS